MLTVNIFQCFYYQNYKTALHLAVLNEKTEVVKRLVDAGIEVNLQEKVSEIKTRLKNTQSHVHMLHENCQLYETMCFSNTINLTIMCVG